MSELTEQLRRLANVHVAAAVPFEKNPYLMKELVSKSTLSVAADEIERLTAELNEAAEATGIAGVDEPMSLLQCIQSLRAELRSEKREKLDWMSKAAIAYKRIEELEDARCPDCNGHGWVKTSPLINKPGQFGTGEE